MIYNLTELFRKELLDLVDMKYPGSVDGVVRIAMASNLDPEEAAAKLVKLGDATYKSSMMSGEPVAPYFAKSCY